MGEAAAGRSCPDLRAVIIVLDGVGAGELPDAALYGDAGTNTLGNLARVTGGLELPHLGKLGLGHILPVSGVPPVHRPSGAFGRMAEVNPGKDSTSGHWELAGVHIDHPFPTYPEGFPRPLMEAFEAAVGRRSLGNEVASGTEIIQRLGDEHVRTGRFIVYTSADSVFQVAAHEGEVPLEELYEACRRARRLLTGAHGVGRVIARPFAGGSGKYYRTENRRDFSIEPPDVTLLDRLKESGWPVVAIGKIVDLYAGRGMTEMRLTHNNREGMNEIKEALRGIPRGLVMANLVDFDMLWGHRNDPQGFKSGLEEFDRWLPETLDLLREEDLLFITADHGNDPTTPSTDHSREHVPLLVAGPRVRQGRDLGVRSSFSDLGATVMAHFGLDGLAHGVSFYREVRA